MLVISWVVFVGFSLGCATAKDMIALYEIFSPSLFLSFSLEI